MSWFSAYSYKEVWCRKFHFNDFSSQVSQSKSLITVQPSKGSQGRQVARRCVHLCNCLSQLSPTTCRTSVLKFEPEGRLIFLQLAPIPILIGNLQLPIFIFVCLLFVGYSKNIQVISQGSAIFFVSPQRLSQTFTKAPRHCSCSAPVNPFQNRVICDPHLINCLWVLPVNILLNTIN